MKTFDEFDMQFVMCIGRHPSVNEAWSCAIDEILAEIDLFLAYGNPDRATLNLIKERISSVRPDEIAF